MKGCVDTFQESFPSRTNTLDFLSRWKEGGSGTRVGRHLGAGQFQAGGNDLAGEGRPGRSGGGEEQERSDLAGA